MNNNSLGYKWYIYFGSSFKESDNVFESEESALESLKISLIPYITIDNYSQVTFTIKEIIKKS